uniref:Uncharacterized protein n=1 Tax=Arthrobacter sp. J3.40 TaxID=347209 RepID=I3W134_9MICC|nr:hypothetical protein [Arthrobacter sp. J3.40]
MLVIGIFAVLSVTPPFDLRGGAIHDVVEREDLAAGLGIGEV